MGLQDEVNELKDSTLDAIKDDENSFKNLENFVNELKTINLVFSATTIISIMAVIVLLVIIRLNKS